MKHFIALTFLSFFFLNVIAQTGETIEADRPSVKIAKEETIEKGSTATAIKNQGQTGTCWAFSTTSLLESQGIRNNFGAFDLSEMYLVRNVYIEKAKNYILRQGKAQFSEGGLGHDVIRATALYGAMPESVYSGLTEGNTQHNHTALVQDLKRYLDTLLAKPPVATGWLKGFIRMLDKTMGVPPATFAYKNKVYTPQTFAKEVLRFNAGDYVNITSFMHHPYYESFILEVPDNFSNGAYYNLPLFEMLSVIKNAVSSGYTVMWDADISNSGFQPNNAKAEYIAKRPFGEKSASEKNSELPWSDTLRQRLFEELTTQDDHLMHLVGIEKDADGKTYFKVKNSWGEVGPLKGYLKVSEAYLAVNTISIIVPRAALSKVLQEKIK